MIFVLAEEWRNWLFYFSLPVMTKYLIPEVKNHWKTFVEVMILLKSKDTTVHQLIEGIHNQSFETYQNLLDIIIHYQRQSFLMFNTNFQFSKPK